MKYRHEEVAPSKKPRFVLATGTAELRVLKGLLDNACRHMPLAGRSKSKTNEYLSTARTLRNMRKEVGKALEDAEKYEDE